MNQAEVNEIKSRIDELQKMCCLAKTPFFATVVVDDDGKVTNYYTKCISPAFFQKGLSEDRFAILGRVLHQFEDQKVSESTELPEWVNTHDKQ